MTGLGLRVLALFTLIIMIGYTASAEETPDISLTRSDVTGVTSSTYAQGEIKKSGIEMYGYFNVPSNSTIGLSKNSNKTGGNWLAVKTNTVGKISKIIVKSAKTANSKTTTLQVNKNNTAYDIEANTRLITSATGTSVGSVNMVQNSAKDYEFSIGAEYFVMYNSTNTGVIEFTGIDIYLDKTPVDPNQPAAPTFTPDGGEVDANTTVTITGDEKTQSLKYWFGDDDTAATTVTGATANVTITEACTLNAVAIGEGDVKSDVKTATYTLTPAINTYKQITTELTSGKYVFMCGDNFVNPVLVSNRCNFTDDFTKTDDQIVASEKYEFTITVEGEYATIQSVDGKYLGINAATNNYFTQGADALTDNFKWKFTVDNGVVTFTSAISDTNVLAQHKGSSGLYSNFAPGVIEGSVYPTLYKLYVAPEAPAAPELDGVELTGNKITGSTLKFKSVEGVSVYYKINETAAESAPRRVIDAAAEGYTKYTEPVTLTTKMTGVSFFAQDDATGAQSDVVTYDIDLLSGIAGIEAEAGEAVYYNLQGVRVDNPIKGLYIRVANGKSSKVVL